MSTWMGSLSTAERWSEQSWRIGISLLVFLFPAACVLINRGDSYVFGLLALAGAWVWLRDGAGRFLNREIVWLALVLLAFLFAAALSYELGEQTNAGFRFLGRFLRLLLLLPVYFAVRRYPPSPRTVFAGMALAALATGVLALWEAFRASEPLRVAFQTDLPIMLGDLSATLILCLVAGLGVLGASRQRWVVPLLFLCVAGGTVALLLSWTRGAWLAMALLAPVFFTDARRHFKKRHVALLLLVVAGLSACAFAITRTGVSARVAGLYGELRNDLIALDTDPIWQARSASVPQCVNSRAFLYAWLEQAGRQHASDSLATVKKLSEQPIAGLPDVCVNGYGLYLENANRRQSANFVFLRRQGMTDRPQHSAALLRGEAGVQLGGGPLQAVHTLQWQQLALSAAPNAGNTLVVVLPPLGKVWLVPLESYSGEYSFSIADDSGGLRLLFWRSAWRMFLQHPLLGVGTGAFESVSERWAERGLLVPAAAQYDHPHNDYFNALAGGGLIGFAALLALFWVPARRYWRDLSSGQAAHAVALAGLLTVAGFAIYALTDTVFLHSIMISWYVVYMAVFYALLDREADAAASGVR